MDKKKIEQEPARFDAEIDRAKGRALERLGSKRRLKLGDWSLPEEIYQQIRPALTEIYSDPILRRSCFRKDAIGARSRRILIAFMSELIYWEYDYAFWRVLYSSFSISGSQKDYHWFTSQMLLGYAEQNIDLIVTKQGRQFVRTIIAESGFSRQIVRATQEFLVWFFNRVPDLDPRQLDRMSIESRIEEYELSGKEDLVDLIEEMIWDVSKLLRYIRRNSLIGSELRDPEVLQKIEADLGFHPIRDIFGFRDPADLQELLETLSARVTPERFSSYIARKLASAKGPLEVRLPTMDVIEDVSAGSLPIQFGLYTVGADLEQLLVVPKDNVTYSHLESITAKERGRFHRDIQHYVFIHDTTPFEVLAGRKQSSPPREYAVANRRGYLWYGPQRIGIPLRAYRSGTGFASLDPYYSTSLNPRIRLNHDRDGLELVIPSFSCCIPERAGATCQLQIGGISVEDTSYLLDNNGFLQLQGIRKFRTEATTNLLRVALAEVDSGEILASDDVHTLSKEGILFSGASGEAVPPGESVAAEPEYYFLTLDPGALELGKGIKLAELPRMGAFHFFRISWPLEEVREFMLTAGGLSWSTDVAVSIRMEMEVRQSNPIFKPLDGEAAFACSDIEMKIRASGQSEEIARYLQKSHVLVEKDDEFVSDFGYEELVSRELLVKLADESGSSVVLTEAILETLVGSGLVENYIGTWRFSVAYKSAAASDLESLSSAEFSILPNLEFHSDGELLSEGIEAFFSVRCSEPFLADYEERPSRVIQVSYVPQTELLVGKELLKPKPVQKIIRLYYPANRVQVEFTPERVFAIRLHGSSVTRNGEISSVTRDGLSTSRLYVSGTPGAMVEINVAQDAHQFELDDAGSVMIPLAVLKNVVKTTHIDVDVRHISYTRAFHIIWPPSFSFLREECHWIEGGSEGGKAVLAYAVDGAEDSIIRMRIVGNRGQLFLDNRYPLAAIARGQLDLEIRFDAEKPDQLHCSADFDRMNLDTVTIPIRSDLAIGSGRALQIIDPGELGSRSYAELLNLLTIAQVAGETDLADQILGEMYTSRCLDQIYREVKARSFDEQILTQYFEHYDPNRFPEIRTMPIPTLKRYCILPSPALIATCSEALIAQNDGVGVDHVIEDLMLEGHIDEKRGIAILSANRKCSSEIIRDIVKWDDLEREPMRQIDLLIRLCEVFHPAMKRKARAAKDWKRVYDHMTARDVVHCKAIDWSPRGVSVAFGLLVGEIPLDSLDAKVHGLGRDPKTMIRRLPVLLGKTLPLIATMVSRRLGFLLFSELAARKKLLTLFVNSAKKGERRQGVVTGITDHGIFVDMDGVVGLVHESDIRPKRQFRHISKGDRVDVRVKKIERGRRRIALTFS